METDSLAENTAAMGNELTQLVTNNILSMWSSIIAMLPSMIGALILLIFGYVLARIIRFMLVKSLTTIGVDKLGAKVASSFGGEGVTFSISAVIGKIVFWLIMVSFFIMATDILGMKSVSDTIKALMAYVPNVIAASIIAIVGIVVADFVKNLIETSANSLGLDVGDVLGRVAQSAIMVLIGIVALGQLGLDTELMRRVIEIGLMTVGLATALAVGLGGRGIASKIISGMYARDQFEPGAQMNYNGKIGEVVAVTNTTTTLELSDGSYLHIPNDKLLSTVVTTQDPED